MSSQQVYRAIIPEEYQDNEDIIIYYFSNFKMYTSNLIQELKMCTIFCNQLITSLGDSWLLLAQQTAYIIQNNQKVYATSRFVLDTFIYAWFMQAYNENDYDTLLKEKLLNFRYESEDLDALKGAFVLCAKELASKYNQEDNWQISFNRIITPLLVLKESQSVKLIHSNQLNIQEKQEDDGEIAQLIEHIRIDEGVSQSCNNRSMTQVYQEKRSISDLVSQKKKHQRILMDKLQSKRRIAENLVGIPDNVQKQKWQTVKQMVVMIWEVDHTQEEGSYSKIRFIQPAINFYSMCLKLWIIEKSSSSQQVFHKIIQLFSQLNFTQFIGKTKHFFGKLWDDRFLIPFYSFFQIIEKILQQLVEEARFSNHKEVYRFFFKYVKADYLNPQ